ncbi:hypothetical protein PUV47_02030 [Pseudovibrio exalbescens]|uniref:hypothetical protein n=1 Tax=Pseudovibrio exalbescens TaxID=197461 RepID=UPI002366A458|nr:hypothetical protein [Pseudovibrio exalbescens]MDD7908683.1 hypothetical protein [Pseudovibrio exalbescens]
MPLNSIQFTGSEQVSVAISYASGETVFCAYPIVGWRAEQVAEWLAAGNEIQPYVAPAPTEADYEAAIQAVIDEAAATRRYMHGNSLASYTASTNPRWAAEAQAFVAWRDAVWAYAYAELDKVLAGKRARPTVEQFLTELPVIEWPS